MAEPQRRPEPKAAGPFGVARFRAASSSLVDHVLSKHAWLLASRTRHKLGPSAWCLGIGRVILTAALPHFRVSNFAPAFIFLPSGRRRALKAVYAFCRVVDDAVDNELDGGKPAPYPAAQVLQAWRKALKDVFTAEPGPEIDRALWDELEAAVRAYSIDPRHLLALVDGVEADLTRRRYETFEELSRYCYGVAGTVGMACLPLFDLDEPTHRDFAVRLGTAVQLTNILRDVAVDAARDRIYLPAEDLRRFGCAEDDIRRGAYTPAFVRLMRFEAARARELYAAAQRALPLISRRNARPALAMGALYRALLDELEKVEFNVFPRRVGVSRWRKIRCVVSVLWQEWLRPPQPDSAGPSHVS